MPTQLHALYNVHTHTSYIPSHRQYKYTHMHAYTSTQTIHIYTGMQAYTQTHTPPCWQHTHSQLLHSLIKFCVRESKFYSFKLL